MKVNLENVNYAKSIIISVFADGKYIERKRIDGEANLNREKAPTVSFDLPDCKEIIISFKKNNEGVINDPRFLDYYIATLFTLFTIFIPKLFTEQYFLNRIFGKDTKIILKVDDAPSEELNIRLNDMTYKEPYLTLVGDRDDIEIVYDYEKYYNEINDLWDDYQAMLLRYFLITIGISAILIIDTFMSIRAGYIGAFGIIMIPMAVINFLKLHIIGGNQKRKYLDRFLGRES